MSRNRRRRRRAASLNTHGMIDMALGDYASAARHLHEAATTAEAFGHALTSYMIEDNIAFLEASLGLSSDSPCLDSARFGSMPARWTRLSCASC